MAVAASVAAVDWWLFAVHGLGGGAGQVLRNPADLLAVLGLSLAAAVFHECGHAAGCRYGGARPGVIGAGIYLVWPSFYTNVTDSYRLSRTGRLRTDLGGLYFNAVFILALAGLYVATSNQVLLLVIALTHLEMLEQLLPFVRFDGYFILSDLAGVPDLFARIAPILRTAVSRGRPDPRVTGLRRSTRIVVTAWVACVIPLLTFTLGYLLLYLPAINRALWHSASTSAQLMTTALAGHRYTAAAADAIGVALAALSLAGSLYVVTGLVRRLTTMGLRWSAGRPGPPPARRRNRPGRPDRPGRVLDHAKPVPWLVSPPATTLPGLTPPGQMPTPEGGTYVRCTGHDARCTCRDGAAPRAGTCRAAPGPGNPHDQPRSTPLLEPGRCQPGRSHGPRPGSLPRWLA